MRKVCLGCGHKSPENSATWCPSCGLDNLWCPEHAATGSADTSGATGLVRADEVRPDEVRRTVTGTPFDDVLGGGVPAGGCLLIWGRSGSGKTRLTSQLCRALHPAVYVSLEETEEVASAKLASLKVPTSHVWVTRRTDWRTIALSVRPALVVVDSISTYGGAHAVELEARACYEWAHAHGVTVAMICHATVDGKAKGGTGPVHWSDAALVAKGRGRGVCTIDTPHKNRYGATGAGRPVGRGSIVS